MVNIVLNTEETQSESQCKEINYLKPSFTSEFVMAWVKLNYCALLYIGSAFSYECLFSLVLNGRHRNSKKLEDAWRKELTALGTIVHLAQASWFGNSMKRVLKNTNTIYILQDNNFRAFSCLWSNTVSLFHFSIPRSIVSLALTDKLNEMLGDLWSNPVFEVVVKGNQEEGFQFRTGNWQ